MSARKQIKIYEMLDTAQPFGSKGDLVGLGEDDARLLMSPADKGPPVIRLVGDPVVRDKSRDCNHVRKSGATQGEQIKSLTEAVAALTANMATLVGALVPKAAEPTPKAPVKKDPPPAKDP